MDQKLNVFIIQPDIVWLDIQKNLTKYETYLKDMGREVDLILLPEMFATGFTTDPAHLNPTDQNIVMRWMSGMAGQYNSSLAGSIPFFHEGKFFNRFLIASPDGKFEHYDKRHLFSIGGENKNFIPGNDRLIFESMNWKIVPLICYDLRFPVWSRNTVKFDLLIFTANWPAVRSRAWEILLCARAIENQCFVIGINRVGRDGNSIEYCGLSQVISPLGELISGLTDQEQTVKITLNKEELDRIRNDFPVLADADNFTIVQ